MSTSAIDPPRCEYCGHFHATVCPLVKAYEYHPDGRLKRVEFKTAGDYSQQVVSIPTIFGPIGNDLNIPKAT